MLSWSFILQRIREEMSLPFQHLEKTDEEIIDYCKRNALKKYATYFPQKWRISLNTANLDVQVPNRRSEYYLIDPDDREIFALTNFVPQLGDYVFMGHPYFGAWTFDELPEWHLKAWKANTLTLWSEYNYTTEFISPNQFRVSPSYVGNAVIEYERSHDPELSTIITDHHDIFTDLCYGMFGMMIGRIRKKFAPIQTPFGEIQINAEEIYNDAKEVYDKVTEKLERGSLPSVIFDKG